MAEDNAHSGHRQRLYGKMRANGFLEEHELLEMLLFNAYPRKNTNPLAHALIDAFGSVKGVFEADYEELIAVKGVGENVADYLKCVSQCACAAYSADNSIIYLRNYGDFKQFVAKRLRDKIYEVLEIYLFEKSGKIRYIYSHTDSDGHRVKVDKEQISAEIAAVRPYGMVIAHNHLTGDSTPSEADDIFTAEMQVLCALSGVNLYDHCIYAADNDVYSYFSSGRIDKIKSKYGDLSFIRNDN